MKKLLTALAVVCLIVAITGCSADESVPDHTTKHAIDKERNPNPTGKEELQATFSIIGIHGAIVSSTSVEIEQGDTVLDVLEKVTRSKGIQLSVRGSGATAYVEGINNLYEFDHGWKSGWKVTKNGQLLSKSAGITEVNKGDIIKWYYTKGD